MKHRRKPRTLAIVASACAVLLLAACGSSDDTKDTKSTSGSTIVSETKPTVEIPDAPAPTALQSKDLTVGSGAEAVSGKRVTVQYVGVSYSTKKQFDASWDRGQPFTFVLGAGNVIKGWDQGVVGMKEGGRRELTIPPGLGYGAAGSPPVIAPNETLVFVVDLVSVG